MFGVADCVHRPEVIDANVKCQPLDVAPIGVSNDWINDPAKGSLPETNLVAVKGVYALAAKFSESDCEHGELPHHPTFSPEHPFEPQG